MTHNPRMHTEISMLEGCKGAPREAKWQAEGLGYHLPGLPPPHPTSRRCILGVCAVRVDVAAHSSMVENNVETLFEFEGGGEYED